MGFSARFCMALIIGLFFMFNIQGCNTVSDVNESIQKDDNYKIEKNEKDEYVVTIYNQQNIVFCETYPIEVYASYISNDIIEFSFSTGNPGPKYSFYYSVKNKQLSDLYENAKLLDENIYYIEYIYMDKETFDNAHKRLVVRDIFNNQKLYVSAVRDFTWGFNPTDAILDIAIKNNNQLYIKYLSGKNEKEVCETINF